MDIEVLFTPGELGSASLAGRTAIVIDVLRATSTIATALANGAAAVRAVAGVEAARNVAAGLPGAILGGERGGLPPDGFDCGNSPLEYTKERVGGREVVLCTTNGTYAFTLVADAQASAVGTAALVNAEAAARWVKQIGRPLTILCAGTHGRFSLEDVVGAGCVLAHLPEFADQIRQNDGAHTALALWERYAADPISVFAASKHGRNLADLGFSADLEFCALVNQIAGVPVKDGERLVWSSL